MYAIVQVGGRQYRAAAGERLVVDRLDVEPGSRVHLADVRMLIAEEGDATETQIGRPRLDDVAVAARAVSHFRGPKILVFKYKPKKRYRRHQGFRAELTELRIEEVRLGAYQDEPAPGPAKKRAPAPAAVPATPTRRRAKSQGEKVVGEQSPAPAKGTTPSRASSSAPDKPKAASAKITPEATPESLPARTKAAKAIRDPAGQSTTTAAQKTAPRARAKGKAKPKQERPDGS